MSSIIKILSSILLFYSIPTFLSGLDIYKGVEPDLNSEWIILIIFYFLSILLFILNFIVNIKFFKNI